MRSAAWPKLTAILPLTLILLAVIPLPRAFAGPPYITDDPEPVEYQRWEVYFASIFAKTAGCLDKHSSPRRSELRPDSHRSAPHNRSA